MMAKRHLAEERAKKIRLIVLRCSTPQIGDNEAHCRPFITYKETAVIFSSFLSLSCKWLESWILPYIPDGSVWRCLAGLRLSTLQCVGSSVYRKHSACPLWIQRAFCLAAWPDLSSMAWSQFLSGTTTVQKIQLLQWSRKAATRSLSQWQKPGNYQ